MKTEVRFWPGGTYSINLTTEDKKDCRDLQPIISNEYFIKHSRYIFKSVPLEIKRYKIESPALDEGGRTLKIGDWVMIWILSQSRNMKEDTSKTNDQTALSS